MPGTADDTATVADHRDRTPRFVVVWLVAFTLITAIATVWNLGQPLFSGADEPEHVIKAQAVWRGQWVRPLKSMPAQFLGSPVTVNAPVGDPGCFIGRPGQAASCDGVSRTADDWPRRDTATYLGRHPVLPYLLNGAGVAIHPSPVGLYVSRLLTTMVAAAVLAVAVALAVTRRRPFLLLGLTVAATPSVLAGFGVLSSSPLEITTSILAFVIISLFADGEPMSTRLVGALAASLAGLALSRPISWLWAGLGLLALVSLVQRRELTAQLRRRSVQVVAALLSVTLLVALVWYFFLSATPDPACIRSCQSEPFLTLRTGLEYYRENPLERLAQVVMLIPMFWQQSLGAIGFNEYSGPWVLNLGWSALSAIVIGLGALFSSARRVLLLILLLMAVLVLPVVVQFVYYLRTGPFWQGRYNLPLQAAMLILAAGVLDRVTPRVPELRRLFVPAVAVCCALQFIAFYGGLRRYVVGTGGALTPRGWSGGWQTPLARPIVLLAVMAVVLTVTYALVGVVLRRLSPVESPEAETRRWWRRQPAAQVS